MGNQSMRCAVNLGNPDKNVSGEISLPVQTVEYVEVVGRVLVVEFGQLLSSCRD